ncbi:hypothetical protein JCM19239_2546 [Vibrio variabilis]|uniref:Uncharacterized protein n=1 Tax=Vibrio variabilis TaxID=990271 RepID=A0ABQ0JN08_9VIBR|nr:hypothetical protein JCM19239_2546 [Vibrio variabilis]
MFNAPWTSLTFEPFLFVAQAASKEGAQVPIVNAFVKLRFEISIAIGRIKPYYHT